MAVPELTPQLFMPQAAAVAVGMATTPEPGLPAELAVSPEVAAVAAELPLLPAEPVGLVAPAAADHDRPAVQFGVSQSLHGCVEGIHVEVGDPAPAHAPIVGPRPAADRLGGQPQAMPLDFLQHTHGGGAAQHLPGIE